MDLLIWSELRQKARQSAYLKMWQNAWRQEFTRNPDLLKDDLCCPGEKLIMDNYIKKLRNGFEFAMFVVNFRPDVELEDILVKIRKCLKKIWFKDWMWNLEQRGECAEEMGKGIHFNLYIELESYKRPSDMHREIYNTFKHLVNNKMCVCGRYAHDGENFKNYVMGIKADKSKERMMIFDRNWRLDLGLKDYYTKSS